MSEFIQLWVSSTGIIKKQKNMKYTTVKEGKKTLNIVDSGVVHNPAPSTPRGFRRLEKRQAKSLEKATSKE